MEPKSLEIRKASLHVVTDLFDLNTAVFTLLLRGVPRNLQVWCVGGCGVWEGVWCGRVKSV